MIGPHKLYFEKNGSETPKILNIAFRGCTCAYDVQTVGDINKSHKIDSAASRGWHMLWAKFFRKACVRLTKSLIFRRKHY